MVSLAELLTQARTFERRLDAIRRARQPEGHPDWYPYQTFSSLAVLPRLLTGVHADLFSNLASNLVLDVGAGDGDLAFFLETLGFQVHAVDRPGTNMNRMEGIRALRRELGSKVEIFELDLDSGFDLPARRYGLICCFGVLYHLKNPFHVLEALACRGDYCLLSTRIARFTPGGKTSIADEPLAYLLDPAEANSDVTNYWIFSPEGLKRIASRAGWNVLNLVTTGNTRNSDPRSSDRDERAFCLLRSNASAGPPEAALVDGWYDLEQGCRWTEKRFSVRLRGTGSALSLRFYLPETAINALGTVSLRARVNGANLPPRSYSNTGEHLYREALPADVMGGDLTVEFELERDFTALGDERRLGVLVPFHAGSPVKLV